MGTINTNEIADVNMIEINNIIIDEFFPDTDSYIRGPLFKQEHLSENIRHYFSSHIDKIINTSKSRTGRFNSTTSTILDSFENIFGIRTPNIPYHEKDKYDETILEPDLHFLYYTNKISDHLSTTLGRTVKKNYLFVTIHCTHTVHGEILALMKMERVSGVQYSKQKLLDSLDLLPSKEKALDKGSVIFKDMLIKHPLSQNYREDISVYHTKFLDKNDAVMPGSFMKKFLDNSIINQDKENTLLAISQIKQHFTPYLKENVTTKDIGNYLFENITYGSSTSVNYMVNHLVNNSNLINVKQFESDDKDVDSSSEIIFTNMLNYNNSSAAEFSMISPTKDKISIRDQISGGQFVKMFISQTLINKGDVILDVDIEELNDIDIENKIFIGISTKFITSEMLESKD